jgi:hypothetical protein
MQTRAPRKSGVIGVTGVINVLKALIYVAFRGITQGASRAWATCNAPPRCNALATITPPPPLPAGLLWHEQASAGNGRTLWGRGVAIG